MDRVREIIAALQDGDNIGAESAFKDAIAHKVGDALEYKRQEVAKSFVTGQIPESYEDIDEENLDEISPELAKRAFDARAKKHKAAMGSASGWDKRADKDAAKGDRAGASAARGIARDKERQAGDMEKKLDRSAKKAGVDAQDRYSKATDDRSPNQKYADYKKKGGDLSFPDYKKKYLK